MGKLSKISIISALCIGLGATSVLAGSLSGSYLAARQAAMDGNVKDAAQYFVNALAKDRDNLPLMENAVGALVTSGAFDRAKPIASLLVHKNPKSQVGWLTRLSGLASEGKFEDAVAALEGETRTTALVDGLLLGWAYLGAGDLTKADQQFQTMGKTEGIKAFSEYHRALLYASIGDYEGAVNMLASEEFRSIGMTRRAVILQLQMLGQLERYSEALDIIDQMFEGSLDPELQALRDSLRNEKVPTYLGPTSAAAGMGEVLYSIANILSNDADEQYLLIYNRLAQSLYPSHVENTMMIAGLLEQLEQFDLAAQEFQKIPQDNLSYHAAEMGRADALKNAGKIDAAIEVLGQLSKNYPELPLVHSALADLFRGEERYEEAVSVYNTAIETMERQSSPFWFIYYARGISFERLSNWDSAENDFRKALELNPNQPQVLNYLGYSLVEQKRNLDEALEMIETAVAQSPDSGYIVDSLAWAMFQLGRYEEAVVHMEKAVELMPTDPIVTDHLGDVYWAVGRKREAEFQWKRALSFDPEEKEADRIRRKLDVGLDEVLIEEGHAPIHTVQDAN